MAAIITATNLVKHYDGGQIHALDGVSMAVAAGEFLAIVGPSGSGKSTLLNMLGALDVPDEGTIVIDGVDLAQERNLAAFRRRTVGFVFQLHNLIPALTAWENVQVPLMETSLPARERKERALELLAGVGLAARASSLPTQLSGGERQRVAIARALVNNPRILIADEPTGAVDSVNSKRIIEMLRSISRDRQMTVVLVTHDPGIADQADRVVRMLDGKVQGS